jgi:uncharacterized membrane protein YoaK (UPF0700 family)
MLAVAPINDKIAMETQNNTLWFTLLLSAVAGYCDTATFIAGNGTFSAHVTGNFIIFAAQVVLNADPTAWIKLVTFPMFIIAVITGGWLAAKTGKRYLLLLAEGILLLLAGGTVFWLGADQSGRYVVVMLTVLAMGLQNTFGKLFPKETNGPTTMMTGNVTTTSLDLGNLLWKGFKADPLSLESLKKQLPLLGGFLAGCFFGGLLAKYFGLEAVLLPGLIMTIFYFIRKDRRLPDNST